MSPVGDIFVLFPPKTGTNLLHPRTSLIVERFGGLRRSHRYIGFDHLTEQDGDHVHANSTCIDNADSLQRHGAPPDNLLDLLGRHRD